MAASGRYLYPMLEGTVTGDEAGTLVSTSSSDVFRFPFTTIEDVIVLDDRTIAVLNDNNFPFSSGRIPGAPDNNEFITIRLPRTL